MIEEMIEKSGQLAPAAPALVAGEVDPSAATRRGAGARLSAGRDRKKKRYLQEALGAIGGGK